MSLAAAGASLRVSSCRECSRRASSLSARARSVDDPSPSPARSARALFREVLPPVAAGRGVLLLLGHGGHVLAHPGAGSNLGFDLARKIRVLFEEIASVVLALTDAV